MKKLSYTLNEELAKSNDKTIRDVDIELLNDLLSQKFSIKEFTAESKNKHYEIFVKSSNVGFNKLNNPTIDGNEIGVSKFILKNEEVNWHLPI